MNKTLLTIVLLLICFKTIAGYGEIAKPQEGLIELSENWVIGDPIPEFYLDPTEYNSMGYLKPSNYLHDIKNINLLLEVAISTKTPKKTAAQALIRLQNLMKLSELREEVLAYEENVNDEDLNNYTTLKSMISSKCLKIYTYFSDLKDRDKEGILMVMEQIRNAPLIGRSFHEMFIEATEVYQYIPEPRKNPNHYSSLIGNGGGFCICGLQETKLFPKVMHHNDWNTDVITMLIELNINESFIYEETINRQDHETLEKYPNNMTSSNDRINLFVVLDSINIAE